MLSLLNARFKRCQLLRRVPIVPSSYSSILMDIVERQKTGKLEDPTSEATDQQVNPSSASEDKPDNPVAYENDDDDFLNAGSDSRIFDPSVEMYPEPYCSIVDRFTETCFEDSILELFGREGKLEESSFDQLTSDAILERINGKMVR